MKVSCIVCKRICVVLHLPENGYIFYQMKSIITQSMRKFDSSLRLLFATEAYGMGADAPDVCHVIHIGPPKGIESKI